MAERFLAAETIHADNNASACEWYGDSAYSTGDLRDAIAKAEHVAVLKPKPLQPAVAGGFTVDDFTIDQAAGTVGCPGAITRPISRTGVATFATGQAWNASSPSSPAVAAAAS